MSKRRTRVGCGRSPLERSALRWALLLALAFGTVTAAGADVPTRYEQFIYSIAVFNGRDYSGAFVRQPSQTLYLIADHDNFIQARETFVYFWPITDSYRLDTDTINRQFDGKLKVVGNGLSRTLSMEDYTYYNLRGEYELNWRVAKGAAAEKAYQDYQSLVNSYQDRIHAYQQASSAYEQKLNDLAARITKMRNQGKDPAKLIAQFQALKRPQPPTAPAVYAVPPVAPQKAFVVNLPAGTYRLEFENPNGTIMQGSEKRLVVFRRDGGEKTGYDVIPADKWTRPESSELPESVLYVNGTTDLYLRPFFEAKYNDLYHQKLQSNDARGNPNMSVWVKLQQVPKAKIVLRSGGGPTALEQQAYAVEQLPGAALGYRIIPWSQAQQPEGSKPDLFAYHVAISRQERVLRVSAFDESGKPLAGARREIRIVSGKGPQYLLLILALLPLAVAGLVVGLRARRYAD